MTQTEKSILGPLVLISVLTILLGFLSAQSLAPQKPFMPGVIIPEKVQIKAPEVVPAENAAPPVSQDPNAPATEAPAENAESWE